MRTLEWRFPDRIGGNARPAERVRLCRSKARVFDAESALAAVRRLIGCGNVVDLNGVGGGQCSELHGGEMDNLAAYAQFLIERSSQ